ncbi:hypothetical protein OAO97_00985 [Candidatus Pseudothioglobus singularis]|nr:hypothetical protein [Candidatus Pseudothioglobus singularis]
MSALIRLISKQYSYRIFVISSFPEIFKNNPRISKNIRILGRGLFLSRVLRFLSGPNLENFLFRNDKYTYEDFMKRFGTNLHLVQAHSLHFHNELDYSEIVNEIYFSEIELKEYTKKFNLPNSFAVVNPNGKTSYTPNKQWGFNNYQEVIKKCQDIHWIQVGILGDSLLENVDNYIGLTSFRELAFLIKKADFVIADEGLLNHIASSFKTKSLIVHSGFSQIEISKYTSSLPIVNNPQVECAPCWITDACPQKKKYCTEQISVNQVIESIKWVA